MPDESSSWKKDPTRAYVLLCVMLRLNICLHGVVRWFEGLRGFSESLLQMIHPHHPQLSPLGDEATCRLVAPARALMENNGAQPQTFVEMVLALLENRYPWLGEDEPVRARKPWTN
jgi:hypothetical protein